jgi:lipopolysaccharide transport system ATP-binding protein
VEYAIQIENVSKRYRMDRQNPHEETLAGSIIGSLRDPVRRVRKIFSTPEDQVHWALKNVSFNVAHGESVGVIGSNGAGKSTLMRIVSNLTLPTEGRVTIHGRVGSLLALGVGFNPELTGRENVVMSAVMLGMRMKVAKRRIDEIIEFAGVEEYQNVAVKRYSTGMRVRLGFSVMSTVEPEILIMDEVLGVGDEDFRVRSQDRVHEMINGGRTVLLVSHNRAETYRLCTRTVHLEGGEVLRHRLTPRGLHYPDAVRRVVESNEAIGLDTPEAAQAKFETNQPEKTHTPAQAKTTSATNGQPKQSASTTSAQSA